MEQKAKLIDFKGQKAKAATATTTTTQEAVQSTALEPAYEAKNIAKGVASYERQKCQRWANCT